MNLRDQITANRARIREIEVEIFDPNIPLKERMRLFRAAHLMEREIALAEEWLAAAKKGG